MKSLIVLSCMMALAIAAPTEENNSIFEIDIPPEEAQQYIRHPPFGEPALALKTAELPLVKFNDPRFRTAEAGPTYGHYWKNGKEIENTEDYIEEVYNAAQYHGQDGLGEYAYGYKSPESAKVENRQHSGVVTGTYTYRDANDFLVQVRYWADKDGFHQEDNLPKPELPVAPEEPQEIREARLAHEKAWEEAAAAARNSPDPNGDYDQSKYELDASASDVQEKSVQPEQESSVQPGQDRQSKAIQSYQQQNRYQQTKPNYPSNIQQQQGSYQQSQYQQGIAKQQQGSYQQSQYQQGVAQQQPGAAKQQEQGEDEEFTTEYPPRGFFYSFEYPVSILVNKEQARSQKQQQ